MTTSKKSKEISKSVNPKYSVESDPVFQTVDIYSHQHSKLRALVEVKRLMGEKCFLYEVASEAVQDYINKHSHLIPNINLIDKDYSRD